MAGRWWLDGGILQVLTALDQLACAYRNGTDRIVIVRCEGHDGFYLERVVFPFELLSFECPPQSELEVWTHGLGGPEMIDRLPIHELMIESPTSPAHLELLGDPAEDLEADGFGEDDFNPLEAAAG